MKKKDSRKTAWVWCLVQLFGHSYTVHMSETQCTYTS